MSLKDTCESAWEAFPATIANGTALSGAIDLGGLRLFGVAIPSAWTTAVLSFQMSPDGGTTWYELLDQTGAAITAAATASGCLMLDPKLFAPLQLIKIRSGLSSTPVNQAADRVIQLILRSV
ncbi:MAG: hypothetical protein P4M13_02850 [Alphaproteobacteria bacterium]|nr:hypothetical protein [Alphaproteobacteria bacterium]